VPAQYQPGTAFVRYLLPGYGAGRLARQQQAHYQLSVSASSGETGMQEKNSQQTVKLRSGPACQTPLKQSGERGPDPGDRGEAAESSAGWCSPASIGATQRAGQSAGGEGGAPASGAVYSINEKTVIPRRAWGLYYFAVETFPRGRYHGVGGQIGYSATDRSLPQTSGRADGGR